MIDPADSVTESLPVTVPCPLLLRFTAPDRIYAIALNQDLLGDWCLMLSWGGKGILRGGGKMINVENFEAGLTLLRTLTLRREKHGYQLVA